MSDLVAAEPSLRILVRTSARSPLPIRVPNSGDGGLHPLRAIHLQLRALR